MEIDVTKMSDPPEKIKKMYRAVSELLKERREISTITVSQITERAGIGKGTAYGYFDSKEDILAHALMYEYSVNIQKLAEMAFEPQEFKTRCYRIMDWIKDNREYNHMFVQIMGEINSSQKNSKACDNQSFANEVQKYLNEKIDEFMEYGFMEGAFNETSREKRNLALVSAMVEYGMVVNGPKGSIYKAINDTELRAFVYHSIIASLTF